MSQYIEVAHATDNYEYVKEFGEGVDRMFNEMENAGLPDPEYTDNAFMLNVTIRNGKENGGVNGNIGEVNGELNPALLYLNKSELAVYHLIEKAYSLCFLDCLGSLFALPFSPCKKIFIFSIFS